MEYDSEDNLFNGVIYKLVTAVFNKNDRFIYGNGYDLKL